MVFEQIFKPKWVKRKEHAFFLGFIYTLVGLVSAGFIFPASFGLMSVAFTALLLIPSLTVLMKMEENVEIREKKFSIKQLFIDHKDIFKVYIFLFLGVFLAYSLATLIFPELLIQRLFASQLKAAGLHGFAFNQGLFWNILLNNLLIFAVAFVLSLVYGAGAVLFLVWNASVWGVVFAFFAKTFSPGSVVPYLPHIITEAIGYISAAIVGGVVSKAILREKLFSKKFNHVITDALIFLVLGIILVVIAALIEVSI